MWSLHRIGLGRENLGRARPKAGHSVFRSLSYSSYSILVVSTSLCRKARSHTSSTGLRHPSSRKKLPKGDARSVIRSLFGAVTTLERARGFSHLLRGVNWQRNASRSLDCIPFVIMAAGTRRLLQLMPS